MCSSTLKATVVLVVRVLRLQCMIVVLDAQCKVRIDKSEKIPRGYLFTVLREKFGKGIFSE